MISAFQGSKSAIQALAYIDTGGVLVVMAVDTTVTVWRLQI